MTKKQRKAQINHNQDEARKEKLHVFCSQKKLALSSEAKQSKQVTKPNELFLI